MPQDLIKIGAAGAAAYMGWRYLDEKHNIRGDIEYVRKLAAVKAKMNAHLKNGYNVTKMWYNVLRKDPNKAAMLYEEDRVTFAEVEFQSNQVANWLLERGLKKGDTVGLLMENRPEFVISWLGMTKIGVKIAMINTAIKEQGLLHCIKVSNAKMLFFGTELVAHVESIKDELVSNGIEVIGSGQAVNSDIFNATQQIGASSGAAVSPKHREGIAMGDVFGYIYTSGTTGLPKAAVILHQKFFGFGIIMSFAFGVTDKDVIYTCLPLFHSAGGGLGIGMMFETGCTIAIKRKFSASSFWTDCIKYNCTVVQYIGELCRYLVLQDHSPAEKQHKVRIAIGNGLRPEIWAEFQDRFNIPEIGEFFGSTEGNGALINHCRTPEARGACGRMGTLLMKVSGMRLVKFDVVDEEPIRGSDGFCVDCDHDEPGELLFPIKPDDPFTKFAGYSDKKATEKKILRDVFVKGDQYFRTGDLLKRDARGYFYFVDRIGDTFRWKGENCSTTEVAEVMSRFPGIEELNVYGIQIPNNMDGRAPAAAVTPKDRDVSNIDFDGLAKHAKKNLPSYAVPIFLRMQPQIAVTATMKHQKVQLRTEGVDPSLVKDDVYWYHPQKQTYVLFTPQDWEEVINLRAKL